MKMFSSTNEKKSCLMKMFSFLMKLFSRSMKMFFVSNEGVFVSNEDVVMPRAGPNAAASRGAATGGGQGASGD